MLYAKLTEYDIAFESIVLKNEGHWGVDNVQPGRVSDGNTANEEIIMHPTDEFFDKYLK